MNYICTFNSSNAIICLLSVYLCIYNIFVTVKSDYQVLLYTLISVFIQNHLYIFWMYPFSDQLYCISMFYQELQDVPL